jgi:carboxyl-terminal processing protease
MRNRVGILIVAIVVIAAMLGGWMGEKVTAGPPPLEKDAQDLLKNFADALSVVESNYARKINSNELIESAIRGMLRTLDPHSSFFATTDYSRLQEEQQGKYFGLGITIRAEAPGSGRVLIVEPPSPGTPAYKSGLRAGDVISRIEGQSIEDWDVNEDVIPNLKGPKGTKVNITIERPGEPEPLEVTVERDEIPLYTIKYYFMLEPGIGYVKIDKFTETTSKELDEALKQLNEASLEGLILDLRDNPGGALGQAIEVSDRFLEKGQVIVSTRSRRGKEREYRAPRGRRHTFPMVVLINQNSASASEIVAGALQDHDRALIVGETSFGKALVQTIYPLDGDRGLALTTGKYYTPSDRLIQRDYSEGFYNYFYSRAGQSERNTDEPKETDGGRIVYGGGGITPDETVTLEQYARVGRIIDRRNLFYEFAEQLVSGKVSSDVRYNYDRERLSNEDKAQIKNELAVSDNTYEIFKDFLLEKKVNVGEDVLDESRDLVKNRLKQELFLQLLGDKEGFRVALEMDHQVQAAVKLLPQAQELAENSIAKRRQKP